MSNGQPSYSSRYYNDLTNDVKNNNKHTLNLHLRAMNYDERIHYDPLQPNDEKKYKYFKNDSLPYLSANIGNEEKHPQYVFLAPIFNLNDEGILSKVYYPRLNIKKDDGLATTYDDISKQMKWLGNSLITHGLREKAKNEIKIVFNKKEKLLNETFGLSFIDLIVKAALLKATEVKTYLDDLILNGNIPTLETFNKVDTEFSLQINNDKFIKAFGLYPVFQALVENSEINYENNFKISVDDDNKKNLSNLINAIVKNDKNQRYMDQSLLQNLSTGGRRRTRRKSRKSRRRSQKNNRRRSRRSSQKNNRRSSQKNNRRRSRK